MPESTTVLRSLQNPEHNGIIGSWSSSKLPSAGSEVPILKLPGPYSCLPSRCKELYRPPSFYKAMKYSKILNHGTSSNERSGCAECPRKVRAMEVDWRKDTSVALEEKSAVPAVTSNRSIPPTSPAISATVQPPSSVGKASEKYLAGESPDHYPPIQEALASNDSSIDGQRVNEANMGFEILLKKELRHHAAFSNKNKEIKIEDSLQVKAMRKTTCCSSAADVSINSMSSVEPSYTYASKELHKANARLKVGPDHSDLEIWQFPHCIEKHDVAVDGRDSYRSKSRFVHWFPDNDKSDCSILSGEDKDESKVSGASTGKSMKENHLVQGKPKEASTYVQKATFNKKTKTGVSGFLNSHYGVKNSLSPDAINHNSWNVQDPKLYNIVDEADSSLELNLPDENSLIAIDDIYIFEQEEPSPPEFSIRDGRSISLFPGSSKMMGSESGQQILSLSDLPFHESQMNSGNLLVRPSDSLAHAHAPPPIFPVPWKFHHNEYNPFAVIPPPLERVPLKLHNYEPFNDNCLSSRRPQPDNYCPDLDQILSAEPSNYHQFLQTPCCNQEPNVLRSLPLSYQTNFKSTLDVEKRDLLAEERNKYIMYFQLQRKLAQMNIEAAERRAYCKANRFW